jgi:hypothetical protein
MADDRVRQIADAVLYEGHMLFPYRLSALKNRQRWTFGGIYPAAYARTTGDRSRVRFECLVEGASPHVDLEVRFLQIVRRDDRDEAVERSASTGIVEHGPVRARVEARTDRLRDGLHRLSASIENTSDWSGGDRDEAMHHALASAHAVARVAGGSFLSPRESEEGLGNEGLWPVLVGELASPIILDDYPRVAPESPGDFFDGGEIDQLLVLNILGLTDAEKEEVRGGDPRARELLERTEAITEEQLLRLHGTWRAP